MKMLCFWILTALLVIEQALSHNHFKSHNDPRPISYQYSSHGYELEDQEPSGKTLHKIKKLRKKQMLLCLLGAGGGGRSIPLDSPEARLLFPSVVQQTEVNVGSPNAGNHLNNPYGYGSGSGLNCGGLTGSGGGLGALGHPGSLSHPLLSGLGSLGSLGGLGGGGDKPVTEDQDRYLNFNMKRHVVRPLYKSMKAFYRLFR